MLRSLWRTAGNGVMGTYYRGLSDVRSIRNLHVPVSFGVGARQRSRQNYQQELLQKQNRRLQEQSDRKFSGSVIQCVGNGTVFVLLKPQKAIYVGYHGMHSNIEKVAISQMEVKILPALRDNYMYLIIDTKTREAAVVDPVEPELVMSSLEEEENVKLTKVLTTHHHWDHAGGNEKLVKMSTEPLLVYGGDERIGALTNKVSKDDTFTIGELNVRCIHTPCHTKDSFCFYVTTPNKEGALFSGDTLFQAGCGRFFEGTYEDMYDALILDLALLPDDTKVFCGHEYTLENLYYARHVEPDNEDIMRRIEFAKLKRAAEDTTMPSTIGQEKLINPFMRVREMCILRYTTFYDDVYAMKVLRDEKDNFKG